MDPQCPAVPRLKNTDIIDKMLIKINRGPPKPLRLPGISHTVN
jgi:hypothetical protein